MFDDVVETYKTRFLISIYEVTAISLFHFLFCYFCDEKV